MGLVLGGVFGHGISLEVFGGGIWVCAFLVVGMALGVGGLNEEALIWDCDCKCGRIYGHVCQCLCLCQI